MDDALLRWTARLAALFYSAALGLRIGPTRCAIARCAIARCAIARCAIARWVWSAGCVALLAHMACAFHFHHRWSHQAAYWATARQTAERTGLDWGGGVYFNYAFAMVWGLDALWWWRVGPARYEARHAWAEWLIQGYLAFILFNATIVFGAGGARWFGAAALAAFAGWAWFRNSARTV
jgi:hypothetical protein